MLVPSKMLYWNISNFIRKYLEFTLFVSIYFFKKSDVLYFFLEADYF